MKEKDFQENQDIQIEVEDLQGGGSHGNGRSPDGGGPPDGEDHNMEEDHQVEETTR